MMNDLIEKKEIGLSLGPHFRATKIGEIIEGKPNIDQWLEAWEKLVVIEGSMLWNIGDHLNYGEQTYGEMYTQSLDQTNYEYGTLRNAKWVASQFKLSRRRDNLTFAHHQEVTPLAIKDQDNLLDLAEKNNLNRNELRAKVRAHEKELKRIELAQRGQSVSLPENVDLIHQELGQALSEIDDVSIDLIFTDPPYGEEYIPLYEDLAIGANRILKEDGSLICYVGHYALPQIFELMSPHLRFWWPICLKHGGSSARLPGKWVFVEWKPLLWFVKERRKDERYVSDLFESSQPTKEEHDWQQDISEASYFIEQLTNPGDMVLDPFCGSGTTILAAMSLSRRAIGIDRDLSAINITKARINEYRSQQSVPSEA